MQNQNIGRRKALQFMGGTALLLKTSAAAAKPAAGKKTAFTFCLNMATIRGHQLGFIKELETASAAGFGSVEIWIDSLQAYLNSGGTIHEVKKRLNGLGLKVENCICFDKWIANDSTVRKKALDQMKYTMGLLAEIGCKRMAATGSGTDNENGIDRKVAAERYRDTLELGQYTGVVPLLEMWGFMKNLSKANEVLYIAMESGHPSAKVLLDVFHLYRGNTPLDTLHLMSPTANDILHINDYAPALSYDVITDADRIYPGDGIAPLKKILHILKRDDQPLVLSCELFNKAYYSQNALTVAQTSLAKMKAVVNGL
jgi:sugar phosphate isomerase/epimerase